MNKSNNTPSVLQALQEALDLTSRAREEKLRALDPLYGFTQLEAVIVAMLAETPKDFVSMPSLITGLRPIMSASPSAWRNGIPSVR